MIIFFFKKEECVSLTIRSNRIHKVTDEQLFIVIYFMEIFKAPVLQHENFILFFILIQGLGGVDSVCFSIACYYSCLFVIIEFARFYYY